MIANGFMAMDSMKAEILREGFITKATLPTQLTRNQVSTTAYLAAVDADVKDDIKDPTASTINSLQK